jgi:integrase
MQGHLRKRTHTTKAGRQTTTWYVVIDLPRHADGRRRQKWHGGFGTRREAEAAKAKIVHEFHTGSYVEPNSTTLSDWVHQHWLPSIESRVKPSTFDSYKRNLELHVLPRLGGRQLQQVTPSMLNRVYTDLLSEGHLTKPSGLSVKTVRYIHTILHKTLADAVDSGLITVNVAERSKPPKPRSRPAAEIGFWTAEELGVFLELVRRHRLEAAWHLAAMTGMRRGEVLGLRWKDIDFDAARISVRQALVSVSYKVMVSTPKNHRARVIDIDPDTNQLLKRHRNSQRLDREELGADYQDSDLVFCTEDGTWLHPDSFSQAFGRLVAKTTLPSIRLHDLRHTHATIALKAGVPIKVITERLGHEDPAFTMKQYAHVIPGMQADAARVVASTVRNAMADSGVLA